MNLDLSSFKEVGGIFKFGRGVLGKSAVVIVVLLLSVAIAVPLMHSDAYRLVTIALGLLAVFGWLFPVLRFADRHPDLISLEGAEWSGYKRFQAAAKGYLPEESKMEATTAPDSEALSPGAKSFLTSKVEEEPDREPEK